MSTLTAPTGRWRLTGFALSAVGSMLFAIKGILIKLIYVYQIDATALLAVRMLISLPVFLGVAIVEWRRRPHDLRPDMRSVVLAALVGVIGYHVSSWLDFEGLRSIEAQAERLILFTYPFFVILFGRMIFGHRLRAHALAGAALSYAGLIVMFGSDPSRLTAQMIGGASLVAAAAGTFALYQLFARQMILRCGPALFTGIAMTSASLSVLTHFSLTHGITLPPIPPHGWYLILALAVFATIVPTFMMSAGTARIGAQGTAIISTISPVVTIVLAILVLGEPFGFSEAAGTMLVIGGVGLFTFVESRPKRIVPAP